MSCRYSMILLLVLAFPAPVTADDLLIDPRLIAEAAEVWSCIGKPDNRIWPGWNASDTPLLFYLPGRQDVLINHPRPPDGFAPYGGPVRFPGGDIHVRTGPTLFEWDGQNTSTNINGVETLVVADTLSNHRSRMIALMNDPREAEEKLPAGEYELLMEEPYGQMAMIAHEAFHVFQRDKAPAKGGNELALKTYPVLSVANNVGFALEGEALARALRAESDEACRQAAAAWLAVRQDRRGWLVPDAVTYEDGTEFNEGLAKYIEYRFFQVIEGRSPSPAMQWIQGFNGYADLSQKREDLIDMMLKHMHGEVNVNNDPFGTAPLRMRLYFSGMAVAALLDRLSPGWHDRILEPETTLTGLAAAAIAAAPRELELALTAATNGPEFEALVARKAKLEAEGQDHVRKMVDDILEGDRTLLTIDYAGLKNPRVAMSFTPFGITGVDEHRTIYRMVPVKVRFRTGYELAQTAPLPLLHDEEEKCFHFQLLETLSPDDIPAMDPGRPVDIALPGARLQAGMASFEWKGKDLVVKLLPGLRDR